jgi:hypothetical protein
MLLCISLLLAAWATRSSAAVLAPSIALETLPVAYFGGNSAPRPAANIAMLANQSYVVIEKWEGACWDTCLKNTSSGLPCEASCDGPGRPGAA